MVNLSYPPRLFLSFFLVCCRLDLGLYLRQPLRLFPTLSLYSSGLGCISSIALGSCGVLLGFELQSCFELGCRGVFSSLHLGCFRCTLSHDLFLFVLQPCVLLRCGSSSGSHSQGLLLCLFGGQPCTALFNGFIGSYNDRGDSWRPLGDGGGNEKRGRSRGAVTLEGYAVSPSHWESRAADPPTQVAKAALNRHQELLQARPWHTKVDVSRSKHCTPVGQWRSGAMCGCRICTIPHGVNTRAAGPAPRPA